MYLGQIVHNTEGVQYMLERACREGRGYAVLNYYLMLGIAWTIRAGVLSLQRDVVNSWRIERKTWVLLGAIPLTVKIPIPLIRPCGGIILKGYRASYATCGGSCNSSLKITYHNGIGVGGCATSCRIRHRKLHTISARGVVGNIRRVL